MRWKKKEDGGGFFDNIFNFKFFRLSELLEIELEFRDTTAVPMIYPFTE